MIRLKTLENAKLGRRIAMLSAALGLAAGSLSVAAQTYPSKPIRMIVGFSAGGASDVMARTTAQFLGEKLGESVVVENKTGAAGAIAVSSTINAQPDGYTVVFSSTGPLFITPQGEPLEKLAPVGLVGSMPLALVVPVDFPANNVTELVALAKKQPGKLTFASAGYGSMTYLGMEMLKHAGGVDITHVPYRGQAAATPDLIAGRVDMLLDGWAPSMSNVQSGKLKYLGVTTLQRSAAQPDVPTIAEQGFPGFAASPWYGIWAPAGTPSEVVATLSDALVAVTETKEFKDRFTELGLDVMVGDSAELERFTKSERSRLFKVIEEANIQLE